MSLDNKTIFGRSVFDLPLKRSGKDIYLFLDELFKEYVIAIKKFKEPIKSKLSPNYKTIEDECQSILSALKKYLEGFPAKSYEELEECLNRLNSKKCLEIQQSDFNTGRSELYRIRTGTNANFKKQDLFHIPFQLREKVATQRYSIPGLPCLYLADSIFVCWEELGRPDFNTLNVARFDLSKSKFKLLYLNISTKEMRRRCFHGSKDGILVNQLVKYLCYWPLLAACSIIVDKPTEAFKPEYIIPQLVLQWIISVEGLDGIQYKSNRINFSVHNIGTFTNIVIPVKEYGSKGYCSKLQKRIQLTSPISWQLLDISNTSNVLRKEKAADVTIDSLRKASYIEMIEDEKTRYVESKFGLLEEKLRIMPVKYIG